MRRPAAQHRQVASSAEKILGYLAYLECCCQAAGYHVLLQYRGCLKLQTFLTRAINRFYPQSDGRELTFKIPVSNHCTCGELMQVTYWKVRWPMATYVSLSCIFQCCHVVTDRRVASSSATRLTALSIIQLQAQSASEYRSALQSSLRRRSRSPATSHEALAVQEEAWTIKLGEGEKFLGLVARKYGMGGQPVASSFLAETRA